jgi:site-specific DNA-methyltransferase (adenine-specific)
VAKLKFNARQRMDGLALLTLLEPRSTMLVVFDPQYRAVLDRLHFGNEGESRQTARADLPQMSDNQISAMFVEIERVLQPSAHILLWIDKFSLVSARWKDWLPEATSLAAVDALILDRERIGMGRRLRSRWEVMVVLQKGPLRAEGIWKNRGIPDVARAKIDRARHPHAKPIPLIQALIECVTEPSDLVVDPCAGGYSTLDACLATGRKFLGCDLV